MPYGRGGAGNILAAAEQKIVNDVEAQRPQPEQKPPSNEGSSTAVKPSNVDQDYAHMGRGGAGNWYSPKELSQTGNFESSIQNSIVEKDIPSETRRTGRGGAGNFVYEDDNSEKAKQQKEELEIELKDMVTRDVEAGLPRPDRAFMRPDNE